MSNALALAAKIFGNKACICVAAAAAGSLATIVVTPMVTKPAMPASYVTPPPMHAGVIHRSVPKPKRLCEPQYIFGGDRDYPSDTVSGGTVGAPEPASFALLGAGLLGMGLLRWKA